MGDCSNAMMRDALPDFLHDQLEPARRAAVQAHLDGCAECRAELQLLVSVRRAVPAPRIDIARTVRALPAYRRRAAWHRVASSPAWRTAAAIVLLAGGASMVLRPPGPGAEVLQDSLARVAAAVPVELSLGETFLDVSDSELRELVDVIDTLEAVLPTEPDRVTVPIAPSEEL